MIWNIFADIRYGPRAIVSRPVFAAVMLTLAFGVNIATLSLTEQILLRPTIATLSGVIIIVTAVAALAAVLPAVRASRIRSVQALREE